MTDKEKLIHIKKIGNTLIRIAMLLIMVAMVLNFYSATIAVFFLGPAMLITGYLYWLLFFSKYKVTK